MWKYEKREKEEKTSFWVLVASESWCESIPIDKKLCGSIRLRCCSRCHGQATNLYFFFAFRMRRKVGVVTNSIAQHNTTHNGITMIALNMDSNLRLFVCLFVVIIAISLSSKSSNYRIKYKWTNWNCFHFLEMIKIWNRAKKKPFILVLFCFVLFYLFILIALQMGLWLCFRSCNEHAYTFNRLLETKWNEIEWAENAEWRGEQQMIEMNERNMFTFTHIRDSQPTTHTHTHKYA